MWVIGSRGLASVHWSDFGLGSAGIVIGVQSLFLLAASAIWMRHLINARIGGVEAIRVLSWPRLLAGVVVCNAACLAAHHLYISFGPSTDSRLAFVGLSFLTWVVASMIVCGVGYAFDGGHAIRVLSDRYKPQHRPSLVDMTQDQGRVAQIIPRGAIFAYQLLMIFTWFAVADVNR